MSSSSNPFPTRLRSAREQRGLSQAELAKKAGLQSSAVSHFETGTRKPSFDNLRRLADALNLSTDYLLGRTDDATADGPGVAALFRHLEHMSEADLKRLTDIAKAWADKGDDK